MEREKEENFRWQAERIGVVKSEWYVISDRCCPPVAEIDYRYKHNYLSHSRKQTACAKWSENVLALSNWDVVLVCGLIIG
jgi:hypothetical protein